MSTFVVFPPLDGEIDEEVERQNWQLLNQKAALWDAGGVNLIKTLRYIGGNVTLGEQHEIFYRSGSDVNRAPVIVRHSSNPATAIQITVPNTIAAGSEFALIQHYDQTGVVTLSPASGVRLGGQTQSVTMDGPGAYAYLVCLGSSAAGLEIALFGNISLGERFTGTTELGEVRGAFPARGTLDNSISSPYDMPADATGREFDLTATSAKVIRFVSTWRGVCTIWNYSGTTHTLRLGSNDVSFPTSRVASVRGSGSRVIASVWQPSGSS